MIKCKYGAGGGEGYGDYAGPEPNGPRPLGAGPFPYNRAGIIRTGADMSVATNDVIRVTAVMSGPSGRIENVFQFRVNSAVAPSDLTVMQDLAQKLDDVYEHMVSIMTGDTVFVEVNGFNVTQDLPMPTVPWPTQTTGESGSSDTPAQVSILALLRTGINRVVGRKFFGGFANGAFDSDGFATSAAITAVGLAAAELIGVFTGTLLNEYLPGVKSTTSGLFWSFFEALVRSVPATQRRRRKDRGV